MASQSECCGPLNPLEGFWTVCKCVTAPTCRKTENMKKTARECGILGKVITMRMRRAGIEAPKGAFVFNASHLYRRTYFVKPVNCSAAHG